MKRRKEFTWIIAIVGISALFLFQLIFIGRLYQLDRDRFEEKVLEEISQGIPRLNMNFGLANSRDKNLISFDLENHRLTIHVKGKKYVYFLGKEKTEKEIFERVYYDASNTRWSAAALDSLVKNHALGSYHSVPLRIVIRDSLGNSLDEAGSLQDIPARVCRFGPEPLGYVTGRTLEAYYYFPFIDFLYHESDRIVMTAALFILLVFFICFLIRTVRVERKITNSREEFMHIVVHNLQSPVDFVRRMSYEIKARSANSYTDEQERLYCELKGRLDTMGDGIRRLLTNSVGVYGMHLEKSRIDLKETIGHIVTQYRMISGKQIRLECDLPELVLIADPVHLSGAIANLVENAVKYTDQEGCIKVGCKGEGEYIRIIVKDDGPGIPEKELNRIFRKYYRVSRGQKGFGLGLNYVWRVVSAHKGKIDVKSKEGCEFTIVLPWKKG